MRKMFDTNLFSEMESTFKPGRRRDASGSQRDVYNGAGSRSPKSTTGGMCIRKHGLFVIERPAEGDECQMQQASNPAISVTQQRPGTLLLQLHTPHTESLCDSLYPEGEILSCF